MQAALAVNKGWSASLDLAFTGTAERTWPLLRRHHGPLRIQKGLQPEGAGSWHQIIVHPPGGIVGGDQLAIHVRALAQAHVLLTTPGAGKWYRSEGLQAQQRVTLDIQDQACLEWLPQETIVFSGAFAHNTLRASVSAGGTLIAADVVALGRPLADERFVAGRWCNHWQIERDGQPLFIERAIYTGGDPILQSPVGLAGCSAMGQMLVISPRLDDDLVTRCRDWLAQTELLRTLDPGDAHAAVTRTLGALVIRWRGRQVQAGWQILRGLWALLRPAICAREVCSPRIWAS